jgi:hypothetical protein
MLVMRVWGVCSRPEILGVMLVMKMKWPSSIRTEANGRVTLQAPVSSVSVMVLQVVPVFT